jgi:hypothetical protein
MPPRHRAAFSKFRCGVAPLRLETGRFEGLSVENRKCPFCDSVEDESHVLFDCFLYDDLRDILFKKALSIDNNFSSLSTVDKLVFLFTNHHIVRLCAKTCYDILQRRSFYLCK